MDIEKLKKQVEEIDAKISEGETVNINLHNSKDDIQPLEVSRTKVRKAVSDDSLSKTRGTSTASRRAPVSSTGNTFDLDLSSVQISEKEIARKIDEVRALHEKTKAKEIPRTRGAARGAEESTDVPPVILTLASDLKNWKLHESCTYKTDAGVQLTAPKDYITDLASIPRVFWSLLSPHELSLAAPVFHDLLYRCAGNLPDNQVDPIDKIFERKEVDDLFLELMKKTGVEKWKRNVAYWAVRGFSGFAWKNQNLS